MSPDDFFNTPVPEEVWHYTSRANFEGIISSGRIWATEAHHTTDPTEFVHARVVANALLQTTSALDVPSQAAKQAASDIVTAAFDQGALSREQTEVFVVSFSSAKDLKSQWMQYADQGRGVSVAFSLGHIRPPAASESAVTLAPCVYDDNEKEALLKGALIHIIDTTATIFERATSKRWVSEQVNGWNLVDRIYGQVSDGKQRVASAQEQFGQALRASAVRSSYDLLRLASHCKHHAFFEEKEWRLALPHTRSRALIFSKVEYRNGSPPIPYVAHKLGGQDRLPITQVMVGPYCSCRQAVENFLAEHKYSVPVVCSEIPVKLTGS